MSNWDVNGVERSFGQIRTNFWKKEEDAMTNPALHPVGPTPEFETTALGTWTIRAEAPTRARHYPHCLQPPVNAGQSISPSYGSPWGSHRFVCYSVFPSLQQSFWGRGTPRAPFNLFIWALHLLIVSLLWCRCSPLRQILSSLILGSAQTVWFV